VTTLCRQVVDFISILARQVTPGPTVHVQNRLNQWNYSWELCHILFHNCKHAHHQGRGSWWCLQTKVV